MSSPTPEPRSSRAVSTALPMLMGMVMGLALAICGALLANGQMSPPTGLRPGEPSFAIYLFGNWLMNAGGAFTAAFAAIQLSLLLRERRATARRDLLLRALAAELDDLNFHDANQRAIGITYRDPVRLTLPARLLDVLPLGGTRDKELLAALLRLQAAIGRYNDLVLTNALVLAEDGERAVTMIADEYWHAIVAATRRLLPHLPR